MDSVPGEEELRKVLALQASTFSIGCWLGPMIGGLLVAYGFSILCNIMGAICLVNAVLGFFLWKEPKQKVSLPEENQSDTDSSNPQSTSILSGLGENAVG